MPRYMHSYEIVSVYQKTGQTALHYAVAKNFLSSVQILIFSGADSNVKDKVRIIHVFIALCSSYYTHVVCVCLFK